MKIVTSESGSSLLITRSEWGRIGVRKGWLLASSHPLEIPFGGFPGRGGFGSWTEYELGAGLIGEALHCILGSLGKIWRGVSDFDLERGHIMEEVGLIDGALSEYARSLYWEELNDAGADAVRSRESMKRAAVGLTDDAGRVLGGLGDSDVERAARACAECALVLASAVLSDRDVFRHPGLFEAFSVLRSILEELFSPRAAGAG